MDNLIFKGLVGFVKEITGIEHVFQGFQNMSSIEEECAIISFINKRVLGTPLTEQNDNLNIETIGSQVIAKYQCDILGEDAYNKISRLRTLFSHEKGIKYFKEYNFAPVSVTEIRNLTGSTIINENYFRRFGIDFVISYRDNTIIDIEYIDDIEIRTINVNDIN